MRFRSPVRLYAGNYFPRAFCNPLHSIDNFCVDLATFWLPLPGEEQFNDQVGCYGIRLFYVDDEVHFLIQIHAMSKTAAFFFLQMTSARLGCGWEIKISVHNKRIIRPSAGNCVIKMAQP